MPHVPFVLNQDPQKRKPLQIQNIDTYSYRERERENARTARVANKVLSNNIILFVITREYEISHVIKADINPYFAYIA